MRSRRPRFLVVTCDPNLRHSAWADDGAAVGHAVTIARRYPQTAVYVYDSATQRTLATVEAN